jgi:hypothetical protein
MYLIKKPVNGFMILQNQFMYVNIKMSFVIYLIIIFLFYFVFLLHKEDIFMAHYLFILGKDDNEAATRCFQFAKVARDKDHKVDVFLVDGGVMWADRDRDLTQKTLTGDCPNDYLPYLVEKEVPVGV